MNIPGREEYGKFVVQPTDTGNPGSWELVFDGLLLAIYDTASKSGSLDNRNIIKIMNRPPLQRLYTWKDLLHDRRMFFDKCFRKGYYFQFPFNITVLEKVWFKILAIINDDVNSIDFNIVYEKKRAGLKGVLYTIDPKIYKTVHYGYEELQEKVDSLIVYFEEKGDGNAEIQNNEQSANEISVTSNRQAYSDPKAITNDPSDIREIWYKNSFPISKNEKTMQYEINKMPAFIARLYEENYIDEDTKTAEHKDAVTAEWIYENIKCTSCSLESIKKYIRECKRGKKQ